MAINPAQVVYFQLLGGIWILQTLPSVFLGLYTNWFNRWALLIGWAAGMIAGTSMFIIAGNKPTMALFNVPIYIAVAVLVLNLLLAVILTPIFKAIGLDSGKDSTSPADYEEEYAPVERVEVAKEALG
ncbi:hypothetical protein KDW_34330 [Dictyobacter vulcani]|uniref:Sodium/proline symporter n=1 Tax=Dictyobacter vulcani TaxID=2607529 RepID=A0A5J4KS27_9CHLR|nr:hypothetical protein [Dictyobacter vulcani]GER89271.1 hypothetical protein KDW_34330 [Dictyobacter vulcani]